MRFTTIICGGLLTGLASTAFACDLPKLITVPPKDQLAGKEVELRAAAGTYFEAMQTYTACVQAELTAAGGDSAPELVKRVLIQRNNTAVAEAQFMMKLFTDAGVATPPAAAPAPAR